jgi:hypothetical protein
VKSFEVLDGEEVVHCSLNGNQMRHENLLELLPGGWYDLVARLL